MGNRVSLRKLAFGVWPGTKDASSPAPAGRTVRVEDANCPLFLRRGPLGQRGGGRRCQGIVADELVEQFTHFHCVECPVLFSRIAVMRRDKTARGRYARLSHSFVGVGLRGWEDARPGPTSESSLRTLLGRGPVSGRSCPLPPAVAVVPVIVASVPPAASASGTALRAGSDEGTWRHQVWRVGFLNLPKIVTSSMDNGLLTHVAPQLQEVA